MSATATSTEVAPAETRIHRGSVFGDVWVIARRGLLHMRREPEALADATFQPVMFVLLFAYVFGGAIAVKGGSYKEYLIGGIFAQTIVFGCFGVAMGVAADRTNGAVDRFRSLPIAKGAVLGGYAVANLLRTVIPVTLMSICGLIVGWAPHASFISVVGAYGMMFFFSFVMIWVGILLGSSVSSPEAVQGIGFVAIFPITFIASTFVPVNTLPGILGDFAKWNPVTSLAGSLRQLFGNPSGLTGHHQVWPIQHPVPYTLIWGLAIILICAPLAVAQYQRSVKD
jgi:ABC-2 type transport system permease protein